MATAMPEKIGEAVGTTETGDEVDFTLALRVAFFRVAMTFPSGPV